MNIRGAIVNMSSVNGTLAIPSIVSYNAAMVPGATALTRTPWSASDSAG